MFKLSTRVATLLNDNEVKGEMLAEVSDIDLLQIKGFGIKALEEVIAYRNALPIAREMPTMAEIRGILAASAQVEADLNKLKTFKRPEYEAIADIFNSFISNTRLDGELERFLENMIEQELHNTVAGLSYIINDYSITGVSNHFIEAAKLSLASTILTTYLRLDTAHRRVESSYFYTKTGGRLKKDTTYVGDASKVKLVKNEFAGIEFQAGVVTQKRVKGKAGFKGMKLKSNQKTTLGNASSMKLRRVTDIDMVKLMDHIRHSNEFNSIRDGEFLKGRKTPKTEIQKDEMIIEELEAIEERYARYIKQITKLDVARDVHNIPIYLTMWMDYRGRFYYDLTNPLLNPQSSIGKYMWEAYNARTLNELDYASIAFSIMSELNRCNPDNALALFEQDVEGNISKYLDSADNYLEEVYNKRVVQAYYDYLDGTPNRTFVFRDFTNGGAIHFATGLTREPKALGSVNMYAIDNVNDNHSDLRESFNAHTGLEASRKDIKSAVSQGITAGVSAESAIKKCVEYFKDNHDTDIKITKEEYKAIIKDVYGNTGALFHEFNKEGNSMISNEHSLLKWTNRHGNVSMSIPYLKGYENKVYYVSSDTDRNDKGDLKSMTIFRNMPIHKIVVQGKWETATSVTVRRGKTVESKAKVSGFLANVTHSIDAVTIADIINSMADVGTAGIFIHDNIGCAPIVQSEIVVPTAQAAIRHNLEELPMLQALEQVTESYNKVTSSPRKVTRMKYVLSEKTDIKIGKNFMQA